MADSDLKGIYLYLVQAEYGSDDSEGNEEDDGTHNIKGEMHHRNLLCVTAYTDACEKSGHTGTDVLTHNDGNRHTVADEAVKRKGLQYTHACRGALNDTREDCAHENTHKRIVEHSEQLLKLRHFGERFHRVGHKAHTEH